MFQDKYVFPQLTAFLNRKISVAIITYCLVAIVHHDMQLKRSTYEVLQILSISLTDKTRLRDLFDKTIFNDVKELDYPLFKGLFDLLINVSNFYWTLMMAFIKSRHLLVILR